MLLTRKIILILMSMLIVNNTWGAEKMEKQISGSFLQVILDSGFIGILIWLMLFLCSLFTVWGIIDALMNVTIRKICPPDVHRKNLNALSLGDSDQIMENCRENPSFYSNVIEATILKLSKGYSTMEETAHATIQEEEEKRMHRLGYLNLWGAIAPMLGLLGTVTGMVDAFFTLGNAAGVEKAQMLAMAISQALYTTAAGLFISIPAIVAYNIFKNRTACFITCTEKRVNEVLDDVKGRV